MRSSVLAKNKSAPSAQFAEALGEEINIALNTRRWSMVLHESAVSEAALERLVAGLGQRQQAGTLQSFDFTHQSMNVPSRVTPIVAG